MNWIAIGLTVGLAVPQPMTMEEAVQEALVRSQSVRIARVAAERADLQADAAAGGLGFSANASAQYLRFEGTGGLNSGGGGFGGGTTGTRDSHDTTPTFSTPKDSKTITVSAQQIFDITGTIRAAIHATRHLATAAEIAVRSEENATKGAVRQAYLQALQASELLEVQSAQLANARERLSNAELLFDAGSIPEFDVLRLRNEVVRGQKAESDALNTVTVAKQAVNNAIGRPINTEFVLVPVQEAADVMPDDLGLVVLALMSRPELQATDEQIKALMDLERSKSTLYKPTLALSAQHTRVIDPFPGSDDQSTLGALTLSVPIADGGVSRAETLSARADTVEAQIRREQLALGIALQVQSTFSDFENAVRGVEFAQSSVELAGEAYRIAKLRYDEGVGALTDVIIALNELATAQAGLVQARYERLRTLAALRQAVGNDDLRPMEEEPLPPVEDPDYDPNNPPVETEGDPR